MCSTCWIRLPNTGTPGSWYIARCQTLAAIRGVALVAPEGVDADLLTARELDVHHRRAGDLLLRVR